MFHKSRSAPAGVVVLGAGVMGCVHAEAVAGLKEADLAAVVDSAETKQARTDARRLSAVRGADAIQRSLKSGKPVALPG